MSPDVVYLLIHDGDAFESSIEIVGVFRDREKAEALRVTRTPSGRRSTAYGAHNEACCRVYEFEVRDE